MTTLWWAIVATALVSLAIKAAAPAVLGDRTLPGWASGVITLLAPALLAALVVVDVLGPGWKALNWPMVGGLAAVVVAHLLRAPMLLAVAAGIVITALLRLVAG
jgi:branched-subunit amino acid transport protein